MLGPSYCWRFGCVHYNGVVEKVDGEEASQVHTCEAFPEGIPDAITDGDEFHTDPVNGDHDIQFERDVSLTDDQLHERMFGDVA